VVLLNSAPARSPPIPFVDREDKTPKGFEDYYELPAIRELPQFAVELIPMLFQDDTHYLAGRPGRRSLRNIAEQWL
jgi:hypothetical protein